jgi:hypothetical protein
VFSPYACFLLFVFFCFFDARRARIENNVSMMLSQHAIYLLVGKKTCPSAHHQTRDAKKQDNTPTRKTNSFKTSEFHEACRQARGHWLLAARCKSGVRLNSPQYSANCEQEQHTRKHTTRRF